jgi:branched-chain amino acid transport system substrate-binding protein
MKANADCILSMCGGHAPPPARTARRIVAILKGKDPMFNSVKARGARHYRSVASACAVALLVALSPAAKAQDNKPLKIGVLTDMSGPFADLAGPGSVEGVRMAVEEIGGTVLGRPIEVVSADHQNKADIGAAIAHRWFDTEGVSAIMDFSNSAVGFAVLNIAKEQGKLIMLAAGSSDFTGKACADISTQWIYNSYTNGYALAREMTRQGSKSWFIITADYAFGHSFEAEIKKAVADNGGEVRGFVRHPLNTNDFSSYLLQAQASGAQVIAFANAGTDTINAVKQAKEFGISPRQIIATPALFNTDIKSMGLELARGLRFIVTAYPDQNDKTRKWSDEFFKRRKIMPSMTHSGLYAATQHYLKAVAAAGSIDGRAVAAKMHELPVDNIFIQGQVRADGQVTRDLYFAEVKAPAESKSDWDLFKIVSTIPASLAYRPLSESECPLVKGAAK